MPTTIPYDPSLKLLNIISDQTLDNIRDVSEAQAPVQEAQNKLNSLLSSKRSLETTRTELASMGINPPDLDENIRKLEQSIDKASTSLDAAQVAAESKIAAIRAKNQSAVDSTLESPVDLEKSQIKTLPLAVDSTNIDVQYFAYNPESQRAPSYGAQISAWMSANTVFGASEATKFASATAQQVEKQLHDHGIEGTLVLSVSCTHKNASVVAPFVLDIDKAIQVWNKLLPREKLHSTIGARMMKAAMDESLGNKPKLSIISGTTYGSAFVSMIHVLKSTGMSSSASMETVAQSLQSSMDPGIWSAKSEGKTGVDAKFTQDLKNLLSKHNVPSVVTALTTGDMTVQHEVLAYVSHNNNNPLAAVVDLGDKVKDIDSMVNALDDFLKRAADGISGIPVNYHLKDIDQKMLAQMWASKYNPGEFMSIRYDDSEGNGQTTGQENVSL